MATVTVRTAASAPPPSRRRVVLRSGNTRLTLPITNAEVPIDLGGEWTTIDRPGRTALLRYKGPKLRVLTLDVVIYEIGSYTVNKVIYELERMSNFRTPISCAYGSTEAGTFHITGLKAKVVKRGPSNNAIEGAATVELTRVMAENLTVVSRKTPAKPPPKSTGSKGKRTVHYTIRRGDTLSGIAVKVCHNSSHWQRIAKDNKIRDPRKLVVGKKLTITCL